MDDEELRKRAELSLENNPALAAAYRDYVARSFAPSEGRPSPAEMHEAAVQLSMYITMKMETLLEEAITDERYGELFEEELGKHLRDNEGWVDEDVMRMSVALRVVGEVRKFFPQHFRVRERRSDIRDQGKKLWHCARED